MAGNWFKFYRKTFDNPWMCYPDVFTVWMHLLCYVAYEETDVIFKGKRETLKPGQGVFTISGIAEKWHISKSKVQRILNLLKNEKQIDTQGTNRNTLITVINWNKYQSNDTPNDTQPIRNRYASDTPVIFLPIKAKNLRSKEVKNIPKVKYAEFVSMTEADHQKLIETYGEADTQELIEILDNYKGSKGKTYKNDYRAILSWVVKALTERRAKSGMARGPKKDDTAPCPDAMYGATVV